MKFDKYFILSLIFGLFSMGLAAQTFFPVGERTITFNDPTRSGGFGSGGGPGRQIETKIYYPATAAGTNTNVASGSFPVVVFGHGFAMAWDAYEPVYDSLAGRGFIVALPRTEGSLLPAPSHGDFGKDLALVSERMIALNANAASPFYQKINGRRAIGGHSMGGGATYLANQYTTGVNCYFTFAAAETNPSAISAAAGMSAPSLVIAGSFDCVAPPNDNQVPIYNAISSSCKTYVSITGGYHCQFNASNFNCNFGEGTCSPSGGISAADQLNKVRGLLIPYLTYFLKGECAAWTSFDSQVNTAPWLTAIQNCTQSLPLNPQVLGLNSFCQGSSLNLGASPSGFSYNWNTGDTGDSLSVNGSGAYSFEASNGICATQSAAFNVTEIPLVQDAQISASGPLSFCEGGSVNLTVQPSGLPVSWNTGASTESITVSQSGSFAAFVGNAGCGDSTDAITVNVTEFPQVINITASGGVIATNVPYSFSVVSEPGVTYIWVAQNGSIVSGQGTAQVSVLWTSTGAFTLNCTASIGDCSETDEVLAVVSPVSVEEAVLPVLGVYPNPVYDELNINAPLNASSYKLIDMHGRMIRIDSLPDKGLLSLVELHAGVYVLICMDDAGNQLAAVRLLKR